MRKETELTNIKKNQMLELSGKDFLKHPFFKQISKLKSQQEMEFVINNTKGKVQ